MKKITLLILSLALLLPSISLAGEARMYLSSGAGAYYTGTPLTSRLIINSGGGVGMNAAEGKITFNPKEIKINSISTSSSIFDLWAKKPTFDNKTGTISFSGGTTKPFKDSVGQVFLINLQALKAGENNLNIATPTTMILSANGWADNIVKDVDGGEFIFGGSAVVRDADRFRSKMSGRILLQVEKSGRSWYVYPSDTRRYFLGRPTDAFNIMRKLGLGVNHKYITTYIKRTFPSSVSGKILIDVEDSGKAYYIDPTDRKAYFLGRPDDAFSVMRKLGLGISNALIKKIPDWSI